MSEYNIVYERKKRPPVIIRREVKKSISKTNWSQNLDGLTSWVIFYAMLEISVFRKCLKSVISKYLSDHCLLFPLKKEVLFLLKIL